MTPDRLRRDEEGVGRRLPVGLQRGPAGGGPDAPEHAVRDRADPLTRAILGSMIEPRGRCAWAGADGPNPDPLMVAYHDDEWGSPVHDDTELFERLALESFQAGLSWSTILRKREAFRAAFRGFDPRVVAAFDDATGRA